MVKAHAGLDDEHCTRAFCTPVSTPMYAAVGMRGPIRLLVALTKVELRRGELRIKLAMRTLPACRSMAIPCQQCICACSTSPQALSSWPQPTHIGDEGLLQLILLPGLLGSPELISAHALAVCRGSAGLEDHAVQTATRRPAGGAPWGKGRSRFHLMKWRGE